MLKIAGKRRKLLNLTQAATRLGIHRDTLRAAIDKGTAPQPLKLGKRRYYTREVIDTWLRARTKLPE